MSIIAIIFVCIALFIFALRQHEPYRHPHRRFNHDGYWHRRLEHDDYRNYRDYQDYRQQKPHFHPPDEDAGGYYHKEERNRDALLFTFIFVVLLVLGLLWARGF